MDGTVAYVYNSAQEAHARSTAERLEREIKELKDIQNSTGKGVITVENIDKQIKERLLSVIGQADSGQYSALEESKEQLLNLLNRRQLITGKAENFNERISDLTAQLDSLSSKFSGEAQTITTTQAGFFFSEVDGYENLTDLSTLTSMTTEEIGNLIATQRSAGNGNAIGKVAEDSDWYYLCLLPEERVQTLTAGTTLVMQVPSLTTTEIPVTVLSISPAQNGQSAVVLRANTISADLSTFRKQPVTLRFRTHLRPAGGHERRALCGREDGGLHPGRDHRSFCYHRAGLYGGYLYDRTVPTEAPERWNFTMRSLFRERS